jgi:type IV fimbrial biogenesis protein FimT
MIDSHLRHVQTGFTLVELVVTVAIVGVLLTLAVPSFRDVFLTTHVRGGASDLQTALYFARSEAIKRACNVDVDAAGSPKKWELGWTVKLQNTGGTCDGTVLRNQNALSDQLSSMSGATITYRSDGRLVAQPASAIVFKTANPKITARCVVVDLSGRPAVVSDTDDNPSNGCQ